MTLTTKSFGLLKSADDLRYSEANRFRTILKRHMQACGDERRRLRDVLIDYLRFSRHANYLIDLVISVSISSKSNERFDVSIDILSALDGLIQDYAYLYLLNDMVGWKKLYPDRSEFHPNEDYWYVLLRSVAKCSGDQQRSLTILSACQDVAPQQVMEAIVEGLGDLYCEPSKSLLRTIANTHRDEFIRNLATEVLNNCYECE